VFLPGLHIHDLCGLTLSDDRQNEVSRPAATKQAQPLTGRPQWQALQQHLGQIGHRHLRRLFAQDPSRGERLVAQAAGLYLD